MTRAGPGSGPPAAASAVPVEEIAVGPRGLAGFVRRPPRAAGSVVFAHGSGSSRFSERNAAAARCTHLFEEPGALEQVIELAADGFSGHCPQGAPAARR